MPEQDLHILLIEDDPDDVLLISEMLTGEARKRGAAYSIAGAPRLSDGLQHLKQAAADVVFVDLNLPDSFGIDTVRSLYKGFPEVPIVVLTGNTDEQTGIAALKEGAQNYLVKEAITGSLLSRAIAYSLERSRIQNELRQNKVFLTDILNSLSSHIAVLDENGVIVTVNEAWKTFARENGCSDANFYGGSNYLQACSNILKTEGDDNAAKALEGIRSVLDGEQAGFTLEYPCLCPEKKRWFFLRVFPLSGSRRGFVMSHENITEQTLAAQQLSEEHSRLKNILDTMPDPVYIASSSYTIEYTNPAATLEMGSGTGMQCYNFLGEHQTPCPWCRIDAVLRGESVQWEWRSAKTSKTSSVFETPLKNSDGTLSKLSLMHDITAIKQAQDERMRLATAIEQAEETVTILDRQGVILYVNAAVEKLMKKPRSEIVGCCMLPAGRFHEKYEEIWKTVAAGASWSGVIPGADRYGHFHNLHLTITPVKDEHDSVTCFVSIGRDMTKEQELEEQLRQAQKMEAIGTLAGGIAHDFNNILGAIIGFTEAAQDETPPESPAYYYHEQVLESSDRAANLVKQILTFSRKSGHERKPLALSIVVKEVIKLLRATLPATIEISSSVCEGAPMIMADATQMHQILMNLCLNAAHAMEKAPGILEISLRPVEVGSSYPAPSPDISEGSYLELTVKDTGAGIAPEIKERIFDPFFTTKEQGKGTGMGLAVVLGIVNGHGGAITLESSPGQGAAFRILLPCIAAPEPEGLAAPGPIQRGSERILFVDDEPFLVDSASKLLGSLGYEVTAVRSSTEALACFEASPQAFDLVITDQTMPRMTGFELARRLMEIKPGLPVILCTGYSESVSEETALAAGIKAFVHKPMNKREIAALIRSALGG